MQAAAARRPRAISPRCSSSRWIWRRASTKANRSCRSRTAQQELDEAIRKLKELAERQEKLAQEQQHGTCARRSSAGGRSNCGVKRRICAVGSTELNRQQQSRRERVATGIAAGATASRASAAGSKAQAPAQGQRRRQRSGRQRRRSRRCSPSIRRCENMQRAPTISRGGRDQRRSSKQAAQRSRPESAPGAAADATSPTPSRLDEALEKFADRTRADARGAAQIENELLRGALARPQLRGRNGRGGIDHATRKELVRIEAAHGDRSRTCRATCATPCTSIAGEDAEEHAATQRNRARHRRLGRDVSTQSQRCRDLLAAHAKPRRAKG